MTDEEMSENSWQSKSLGYKINADESAYKTGFQDGYNRANRWHYVKDGDLPNNYRYVWTNIGASYYDSWDHCWRDEYGRTQGVIAWCEPKFEEQIKMKNTIVWRKIADGDLPKENKLYLVHIKDNGLAISYFNGLHWETRYSLGTPGHCVETVIAWCEIPTFKE